jgi:hypothetical protein
MNTGPEPMKFNFMTCPTDYIHRWPHWSIWGSSTDVDIGVSIVHVSYFIYAMSQKDDPEGWLRPAILQGHLNWNFKHRVYVSNVFSNPRS